LIYKKCCRKNAPYPQILTTFVVTNERAGMKFLFRWLTCLGLVGMNLLFAQQASKKPDQILFTYLKVDPAPNNQVKFSAHRVMIRPGLAKRESVPFTDNPWQVIFKDASGQPIDTVLTDSPIQDHIEYSPQPGKLAQAPVNHIKPLMVLRCPYRPEIMLVEVQMPNANKTGFITHSEVSLKPLFKK